MRTRRMLAVGLVAAALTLSATAATASPDRIIPPKGLHWVGKLIKHDFRGPLGKENYHMAMCVANRESKFDPNAYNPKSGASGVFQFVPKTWAWASEQAGYGGASPFDADANVGTAAWVVENYGWDPWGNHCP
jgi:soluble lytic murein transglycosylase-like protein